MSAMLNRREVVAKLLAERGDDLLVVPGLGQPCYDCFAAGDDPRTFYLWGAMAAFGANQNSLHCAFVL